MFTTVDERIPPNWVVRARDDGILKLAPAAWLEPGFWERYFDLDPEAIATFEAGVAGMRTDES
jgi:hypothetical protein